MFWLRFFSALIFNSFFMAGYVLFINWDVFDLAGFISGSVGNHGNAKSLKAECAGVPQTLFGSFTEVEAWNHGDQFLGFGPSFCFGFLIFLPFASLFYLHR